jgi:ubiquinone/menaquinone biosynthesis C-methylase UbiE
MRTSTSEKYSRAAKRYDKFEYPVERLLFGKLRAEVLAHAQGNTLEVGVGTGKNFTYYKRDIHLHAIDFSPGMLKFAHQKLDIVQASCCQLYEMDAQSLGFQNNTFDTAISTFVFCTVPDPLIGLREVYRVLKPGGQAIFLEHMKSASSLLNIPLYVMNLFSTRLLGTSMIRETQKNIEYAGFSIESVDYKFFDIVRLIITRKS